MYSKSKNLRYLRIFIISFFALELFHYDKFST